MKVKEKQAKFTEFREFTVTSDILILQGIVEDRASIREIAVLLGRDPEEVRRRIEYLKSSGRLQRLHKILMRHKGFYAQKYLKMKAKKGEDRIE